MSQQPPDPARHPFAGPRPPEYVVELWVSEQLRGRLRRTSAAMAHERQAAGRQPGREAERQADLEAEP